MDRARSFFASSLGKKMVMAVTGVILFGFVLVHMAGNLQIYGPEGAHAINAYGEKLREFPPLLWTARLVLLASAILHIWAAASTTVMSRAARPVGYRERQNLESTLSSRTMRISGVVLLAFIIFHLMHFTWGNAHPSFEPGNVFHNFVVGFSSPVVAGFYIVSMVLLGLHMYHGVWSMLQTLGLSHPRYNPLRYAFAALITLVVVVGNISFPLAVLSGFLRETPKAAAAAPAPAVRN